MVFSIVHAAILRDAAKWPLLRMTVPLPHPDTLPHSRNADAPEFANSSALKKTKRAQGRPGARCTRGLMCKADSENAHEHTGSAETLRPSLRNGFTAYIVLSPARPGLFATVVPRKRELPRNLTPAIGASGPHDFAVRDRLRSSVANSASIASHRAFRDVRNAPLVGWDARNKQLSWVKNKAEYFSRRGWTGFRVRN